MKKENFKIIITGGGTGGHVYPAIAIADALKDINPKTDILFIGAEDRLEMSAVPKAGYKIIGLPVKGLVRKLTFKNFKTLWLLFKSINLSKKIFKQFKPDAVIGVGGYASAPALYVAYKRKIPIFLQEQNSYPGITNRIFANKAVTIFAAYEEVKKYIPAHKVKIFGNPLRKELLKTKISKQQALKTFNLNPNKKTLLITGGSLGAKTINNAVIKKLELIQKANIQVIWQTGKIYFQQITKNIKPSNWLIIKPFIENMITAYTAADLVIARAGAITISELSFLAKPAIFVPSPNVAEDHQTKNAMALVEKKAAIMIKDNIAEQKLIPTAIETIQNQQLLNTLSQNIKQFAKPNAAFNIANFILQYLQEI